MKQNHPASVPKELQGEDGKITRDEARDLLKALDKSEFAGLMDNYIKEISDPSNVKETNQFLEQSEKSNDLPPNVKLCRPDRGFCIRSEKFQIKKPATRQKVFINICSYIGVQEPKCTENNMWTLPYLLNKGRHDQDKKNKVCMTYDVVFNPLAITKSEENMSFKKYVCDTAINGINQKFLASNNEKISNDFIVKKNMKYKGIEVSYINVHSLSKGEMDDRKVPNELHKTQMMKEVEEIQKQQEEKNGKVYDQPDVDQKDDVNEVIEHQKLIDKDNKKPYYVIKYSQDFELKNCFYQPEQMEQENHLYKKMVIEIKAPLMEKAGDAELEVDIKRVKFSYKDIYELDIALLVEIKKESVKAKFDQSKKVLSVILDIVQKEVKKQKIKEDEDIEVLTEETEREQRRKQKEEEEKKKKEEEEIRKRQEYEREAKQKQRKLEEESMKKKKGEEERKAKQIEEEQKNKTKIIEEEENKAKTDSSKVSEEEEVFIKGTKKEIAKPQEEIKYKEDDNEEIISIDSKENKQPLIQEIKKEDEDDKVLSTISSVVLPQKINSIQQKNNSDEQKTQMCLLTFQNEWIYDIE